MIACIGGHSDCVEFLLSKGANAFYEIDESGKSCLHVACKGGHADIVEMLLRAGLNVNKRTKV